MFTLPVSVYAQDYYGSTYDTRKVVMGISLAPNMSWLTYDDNGSVEKKAGFGYGYGLLADFRVSQNYYFSTGFLINNLKSSSDAPTGDAMMDYRLQYLKIPITLKLKSTQRYYRSYYGQFGFSGGLKLRAESHDDHGAKHELNDEAEALRLGLQIAGGIEWQLDHKLSMMTGLSYNSGFTSVLKEGKPGNAYIAFDFAIFF